MTNLSCFYHGGSINEESHHEVAKNGDVLMECLVCKGPAEEVPFRDDYREHNCQGCGQYRVFRTLLTTLRSRLFDVDKTRACLESARNEYDAPTLTTYDEDLLSEPGS